VQKANVIHDITIQPIMKFDGGIHKDLLINFVFSVGPAMFMLKANEGKLMSLIQQFM